VSVTAVEPDILAGYQLRLPSFEGPLDVLLRLIERHQLAITDVSLVAVTDQFLAYLDQLDSAPAATVAEFAAMGARLVLIKSRSLLPRPAVADEGEPEELVRQLIEYRAVQAAARRLAAWDAQAAAAFARGEGVAVPEPAAPPKLAAHHPAALARALRRRLTVVPGPREVLSTQPMVTLREMVERVLMALVGGRAVRFGAIRAGCRGRSDVLTAFLAVLVLMRRRVIEAEQPELFGEITLRRVATAPALDPSFVGAADD
jgi:segregation and condensation protein A